MSGEGSVTVEPGMRLHRVRRFLSGKGSVTVEAGMRVGRVGRFSGGLTGNARGLSQAFFERGRSVTVKREFRVG